MKGKHGNGLQCLILCIEAVLIIISLLIGENAKVGMVCYWTIIAVYHLTEFLIARRGKTADKDEADEQDD